MALRSSKSPWQARFVRPGVMTLEDRVVPGEMFGTSMLWAMGAFADPGVLAPDYAADRAHPVIARSAPQPDYYATSLPYVDASRLSVCQIDPAPANSPDASAPAPATGAPDTPPAAATSASDDVFAGMAGDNEFGKLTEDMSGGASAMGDVLHPGATTPVVPNAALGAVGSAQQLAPVYSTPGSGGGLGGGTGQSLGGTLASLASFMTAGAVPTAASSGQASAAAAANTGGGFASPLFKAHAVATPDKAHPDAANGAAPFSPAQITQAYGVNLLSNTGAGQTIYIVDAYNDPNIASDLGTFDSQWGLAAPPNFTVHKMSTRVANSSSWGVEESLDVEWAHAIAPQANIVLVEATSSSNSALFSAVNWATTNGAKIVSMSWGGSDSTSDGSYDSYFEHAGVTYIASAGDSAAALEYPAASPYVLSVGGTSLTLTTSNAYSSESAWADSGGGVSKHESLPTYQKNYGISNSGRSIPDVAWDADPNTGVYVYDSYIRGGGGWYEVGGTSVGAPSWAGIIALADQGRSSSLTTDNLASRTEYNAATGSVYASNYHDITTGSNGHSAGTGYDLVTGVGSPQANNLVPWLTNNN
jgi:hypothetical protein